MTIDTNRSICNMYSGRPTFVVYMKDNKGNVWKEENYEGYGTFGGKCFYELADEMTEENGGEEIEPILVEDPTVAWNNQEVEDCDFQGFFYGEDMDELLEKVFDAAAPVADHDDELATAWWN